MKEEVQLCSFGLLDFHTHSTHSDGKDTPAELVKMAKQKGVSALALTDHHVDSGLEEFLSACKKEQIFAIPFGMEIHAELPVEILTPQDNEAPDLILLGKNVKKKFIKNYQTLLLKDRKERWLPQSIEMLKRMGFYIPNFNLNEQCKNLGIPSIIHTFIQEKGNIDILLKYMCDVAPEIKPEDIRKSPIRFCNKFVYANGRPGYIKRLEGFNLKEALQLAGAMNCRLFIAHPGGEYGSLSDKVLEYYIQNGIHGIEIRNYFNTPEQNAKFDALAKKHDLVRSGGSDYHGSNGPFRIGIHDRQENQVPKEIFERLWDGLPS